MKNQWTLPNGHAMKLVALDMDGTLLQSDQTIEARTKQLLKDLQEAGVRVVLISGRPIPGMIRYGRELDMDLHDGVLIGDNGAHAYSYENETDLWKHPIKTKTAQTFFEAWAPAELSMFAYYGDIICVHPPKDEHARYAGRPFREAMEMISTVTHMPVVMRNLLEPLEAPPLKVCISGDRERIIATDAAVRHSYEAHLYSAFSAQTYFETMLRGINKGTGLQEYADAIGILPENIIAFGDQDNDIPMLTYAGAGVAMAEASDGLIAVATHRTTSHNEGGIYEFLSALS
ncbi:MAG: Cof-type HAD-IIB family hydrolase [Peptoniphilaceae bacterium]|nr:Cof-type HAD-IIB family hydrolase [Peptoniphilaceae bacterium]MDY6086069.1 Cof-type HAD-IIB family hydrolase [Peptoniphilaceae bacterium]